MCLERRWPIHPYPVNPVGNRYIDSFIDTVPHLLCTVIIIVVVDDDVAIP